jgi:hypothetical protein
LRKWNLLVNIPLHQSPSSAQFVHSKAERKSAVLEVKRLGFDFQTSIVRRSSEMTASKAAIVSSASAGWRPSGRIRPSVRFSWLDCIRHQDRRTCQLKRSGLLPIGLQPNGTDGRPPD